MLSKGLDGASSQREKITLEDYYPLPLENSEWANFGKGRGGGNGVVSCPGRAGESSLTGFFLDSPSIGEVHQLKVTPQIIEGSPEDVEEIRT